MVLLSKSSIKRYNAGEVTVSELGNELLQKYTAVEIAKALAEILASPTVQAETAKPAKIAITSDEYKLIEDVFRIKQTGTGRGRKKKQV